jgi:aminoglycoside/choline kinase family phosphotransferase
MGGDDSIDSRLAALTRWVQEDLGFSGSDIAPASADASFRRYFRVLPRPDAPGPGASGPTAPTPAAFEHDSFIVMDAPPEKENLGPFLRVAGLLADRGLNVPVVLARNVPEGLLLMTDLGSTQYLPELAANRDVELLHADALAALIKMQTMGGAAHAGLPPYDRALLLQEMQLMPEWFLGRHLEMNLGVAERALLEEFAETMVQSALAQPRVFVHRDYHSRNLMRRATANPGILDFQDAVVGPVTYDLVSLLKDCYIAWPAARVRGWALQHRVQLASAGIPAGASEEEFLRWFDWMGLQRHIKVLGIFARLFYRDRKSQYLHDLPRVFEYVREAAARYPETAGFAAFIESLEPRFRAAQTRVLGRT